MHPEYIVESVFNREGETSENRIAQGVKNNIMQNYFISTSLDREFLADHLKSVDILKLCVAITSGKKQEILAHVPAFRVIKKTQKVPTSKNNVTLRTQHGRKNEREAMVPKQIEGARIKKNVSRIGRSTTCISGQQLRVEVL